MSLSREKHGRLHNRPPFFPPFLGYHLTAAGNIVIALQAVYMDANPSL